MKSRMRSRSAATSGVGSKSIFPSLLVPGRGESSSSSRVAGEELRAFLEKPRKLELGDLGERSLEDRGAGADEFRRDREEELVGEPRRLELGVQAGAALAEDGADAVLLAQVAERGGHVDAAG